MSAVEVMDEVAQVFVVDDDEWIRDSLKLLLESVGMKVETFASTEDFAREYEPRQRSCLILDQNLQGTRTGLDFLASVERGALGLPVILVTGRGDEALRAAALRVGAAAYIEKPFNDEQLIATINAVIGAA